MLSKFTFHADFGSGEQQLYPVVDDLIFSEDRDKDFGFFRRTLATELVFKGEDFETFYDIEVSGNCERYAIDIRYDGDPYYTGLARFRTQNFKWDIDKCKVTVNIEPQDAYTCLIDEWENDIDILASGMDRYDVGVLNGTIEGWGCQINTQIDGPPADYRDYITDCLPSGANGAGWTVISHDAMMNDDGIFYRVTTGFQREEITMPCSGGVPVPPPGDGWILIAENCPTDATYARALVTELDPANSFDLGGPTANPDEVFYRQTFMVAGRAFLGSTLVIGDAVKMNQILTTYNPCKELTVVSNLLDLNPSGDSPATAPYTEPRTHNILVWQKSSVIIEGTDPATFGIWSFLEVLQTLNTLYDAQPRIIGNTLRIEHSTYWESEEGLDLTSTPYAPFIRGKHQYEYDSAAIPRRERWAFPEEVSTDFLGGPITYNCFAQDDLAEVVYPIERVNTDIGFITMNPTKINKDGFVIAEGYYDGSDYSVVSRYIYPGTDLQVNGGNSIPNLVDHFHRWERPVIEGVFLGEEETFETALRRKKQTRLEFKLSAGDYLTLNPDDLIRSQMGWGKVQSLRWSAKTCKVEVELMHD